MSQRIQKRFLTLASQVYQQKVPAFDADITIKSIKTSKTKKENPLPILEFASNVKDPLAADNGVFDKDEKDGAFLLRHQLSNKEGGTLIQKNNAIVVPGTNTLQSVTTVPGPKIKVIEQTVKKLPIIQSQVTQSFMHYIHRIPLLSGSYLSWAKDIRPYNNLFERYGDMVYMRLMQGDIVMLRRPEHFNIVLGDKDEDCSSQACLLESLDAFAQQHLMTAGGHVLKFISTTEEKLKDLECLNSFKTSAVFNGASNELIKRIEDLNQLQYEVPPDFYSELCKWGLSWQQRLLFNPYNIPLLDQQQLKSGTEGAKLLSAFFDASEAVRKCEHGFQLWRVYNTPSWEKLSSSCTSLCSYFIKQIQKVETGMVKRKEGEVEKPLQNLSEHFASARNVNLDDVLLDMLEMTLVGANVTAFTMGFLLYHLSKAPRVQTRLHQEIKNFYSDKNEVIQFEDIDKLEYLRACVKEALRLQLPIPFSIHKLQKDISINNYLIPKNTYAVLAHEITCLSKDNFEEPGRFLPERWLTKNSNTFIDPMNIQPYGNGTCASIMKSLAEKQMCVLTAKIVQNFWVFYSYEEIASDGKRLAMPTHPFRFLFEKRRN